MSYIKKEDALAAIDEIWNSHDYDTLTCCEIYSKILQLPVFVSYQKKGMWIDEPLACNGDGMIRCSACRRMFREGIQIGMVMHFCPNCGAKILDVPDIDDGKTAAAEFYAEVERESALLMREDAKG